MASLLPALPTEWRGTANTPQNIRYRSSNNLDEKFCSGLSRWGADKREYGGVGGAVDHVIQRGGVASRSHRHYGSGIINCSAQSQPYQITDLLLSDSRPCDQLLPPPLLTDKIIHHRQVCKYPTNHTYTSHRSKFAVFPLAGPHLSSTTVTASHTSSGTRKALRQLNSAHFCTTTYQHTYTNPWTHNTPTHTTNSADNETEREREVADALSAEKGDENSSEIVNCEENKTNVVFGEESSVVGGEIAAGTGSDGNGAETGVSRSVKKRVHWEDREIGGEDIESPREEEEEGANEEEDEEANEAEDEAEEEDDEGGVKEGDGAGSQKGRLEVREGGVTDVRVVKCDEVKEEKQAVGVANSLPQLPHHFRRVSDKYCRNQLSPMWPCSVPYFLSRPHSMLHSHIPRPLKLPGVEPVVMPTQDAATDNIKDDVMGESPPPLSTMLHVSDSRIPLRLGIRFKARAHSRYHQLYPDKTPDLRDARIENRKYFFFGAHSSVLR